jgi:hypothetical protein
LSDLLSSCEAHSNPVAGVHAILNTKALAMASRLQTALQYTSLAEWERVALNFSMVS